MHYFHHKQNNALKQKHWELSWRLSQPHYKWQKALQSGVQVFAKNFKQGSQLWSEVKHYTYSKFDHNSKALSWLLQKIQIHSPNQNKNVVTATFTVMTGCSPDGKKDCFLLLFSLQRSHWSTSLPVFDNFQSASKACLKLSPCISVEHKQWHFSGTSTAGESIKRWQ